jgi:hypothetical protein
MISQLIDHVEINALQEVLPTMNDIFIKVVEHSNQSKSEKK